jgi:hypothetical protein
MSGIGHRLLGQVARFRPDRMIDVTLVYLVQHGEKQRLPGDPGLTELGRQQPHIPASG